MPHQSMNRLRRLVALAALSASLGLAGGVSARQNAAASTSACDVTTSERIVAIGDVHGAYDPFVAILRDAGLVDGRQRWAGGKAIFIQTGDILDRGGDSRKALDLLRRLEGEAASAGGRVIPLLGNHEVMRIIGDLRYVSAGEYAAFKSPDSADLRERYYQSILDKQKAQARANKQTFDEKAFRQDFVEKLPLGAIEMQLQFAADGDYGKWLRTHDTMAVVNGVVFLHGGTSAAVAKLGCAAVNTTVRSELRTMRLSDPAIEKSLMTSADGPLWYRGLVADPPAVDAEALDGILRALHARATVVGHTVAAGGRIRQTFDGRVTQIDTGMLGGTFFPGGAASALELANGTFTAIYGGGKREPLSSPAAAIRAARR